MTTVDNTAWRATAEEIESPGWGYAYMVLGVAFLLVGALTATRFAMSDEPVTGLGVLSPAVAASLAFFVFGWNRLQSRVAQLEKIILDLQLENVNLALQSQVALQETMQAVLELQLNEQQAANKKLDWLLAELGRRLPPSG